MEEACFPRERGGGCPLLSAAQWAASAVRVCEGLVCPLPQYLGLVVYTPRFTNEETKGQNGLLGPDPEPLPAPPPCPKCCGR